MRQLAFGFGSKNGCVCPHSSEHYQIRTIPAVSSLKMRQRSTSAATGTAEPKTSTGVKIDMKVEYCGTRFAIDIACSPCIHPDLDSQ